MANCNPTWHLSMKIDWLDGHTRTARFFLPFLPFLPLTKSSAVDNRGWGMPSFRGTRCASHLSFTKGSESASGLSGVWNKAWIKTNMALTTCPCGHVSLFFPVCVGVWADVCVCVCVCVPLCLCECDIMRRFIQARPTKNGNKIQKEFQQLATVSEQIKRTYGR